METVDNSNTIFEFEVRRIASELFPRAKVNGPVIVDGLERDGIFNDGEVIHVFESTTSRRKDKAEKDLEKSVNLVKSLRRKYFEVNFKIWFITQTEPTADQISVA
jgi:hypothetical protein